MFGKELAILHIDLEEAGMALEEGEIRLPKRKAEEALEGWARVKYLKGMADALRILGTAEYIDGNPDNRSNYIDRILSRLISRNFEQ